MKEFNIQGSLYIEEHSATLMQCACKQECLAEGHICTQMGITNASLLGIPQSLLLASAIVAMAVLEKHGRKTTH